MRTEQSNEGLGGACRLMSGAVVAFAAFTLVPIAAGEAHAQAPQPAAQPADTTVTVHTMGSNLEFMPDRIAVKQGTRVQVRLVNEGTLPHNIVLVKDEADIDMLGMAAFQAKDTGYVPLEHKDKLIAYTDLAAPGETVEMTFEVPAAGEYWFVCLYPGHYAMMVGTLRSLD